MQVKKELSVTEFRLCWWDLSDLTESKVKSWMQTAFACADQDCKGRLEPKLEGIEYICPKCKTPLRFSIAQLANGSMSCCNQPIKLSDPQFKAFLDAEMKCGFCGLPKTRDDLVGNWKVRDLVTATHLYHVAGAWRNMWFNYKLSSLVFYDQRSVRVVPVDHSKDVDIVLEDAKQDLIVNVLPLDTLEVFGRWSVKGADIDALWDEAIKFPKFIASDQAAQRAILDTVKNSILGFVKEANEKVLAKLSGGGKVHKRTAEALIRRLEELKKRDVWNVHADPAVQTELNALEGLLQAQLEE